ncbi:serine protease HTRA2, mitochondrial-like [Penaeus monodon]|uniref:serine protease HTRA2, mitochondrial-like n=1 Tax=Penaeus monodon TaxID=6687 RepID=UPI0018A730AF|nr:serine protease HTRA2, mitochondrial-like [Penaeus monodon]
MPFMKRFGSVIIRSWATKHQKHHVASLQSLCRNVSHTVSAAKDGQKENDRNSNHGSSYTRTALGLGAGLILGATAKTLYDERTKDKEFPRRILPAVQASSPLPPEDVSVAGNGEASAFFKKRDMYNFVADAVQKASGGVVFISINDTRRHIIRQYQHLSNGSGFIVSEDGLILTNAHVVSNFPKSVEIKVRLIDGREYSAVVEEIDTVSDLALLRINCTGLVPLKLGDSSGVRPGEFVAALGCPLSLSNSVTLGVVSSADRGSVELGLRGKDMQYIQTDAAITFGNSGGPLINLDGEVIGINSMTVTSGISFAIPVDHAKEFMKKAEKKRVDLAKYPKPSSTQRRYLGVTMLTLTKSILQELQSRGGPMSSIPSDITQGVFIWKVVVGSPAYQSGLIPGDIITHINNEPVASSRDVYRSLEHKGDLVMVVVRNGQRYKVIVSPEE